MLDPLKNAHAVGTLLMGLGILYSLMLLLAIFQSPLGFSGVAEAKGGMGAYLLVIAVAIGYLAIGFGLRNKKQWAIWGLGVIALINILQLLSGKEMSIISIIITAITGALFVWFLSAKNKFSK